MGIFIGNREAVQEYRDYEGLNQSTLKELAAGLDAFLKIEEKRRLEKDTPKPHFLIGGAVDTILTGNVEDFEKHYHKSALKIPTESILQVITEFEKIFESNKTNREPNLESNQDIILLACKNVEYGKAWKDDTKVRKVLEAGAEYYTDSVKAKGKEVLDPTTSTIVDNVVRSLTENPRTKSYFDREFFASSNEVDIYYQLPIYFTYKGKKCKALLDLVIVVKDKNGKVTSVFPVDLKTKSGFTIDFPTSVSTRRYDLQASWYVEALLDKNATSPLPFPFKEVTEENIQPFKFIVESTTSPGKPLVFTLTQEYLNIGKFGFINKYTGKWKTKGFDLLFDSYMYYEEQGWVEEAIVETYDGQLILDYEGIKDMM